jgi:hypothetical protein
MENNFPTLQEHIEYSHKSSEFAKNVKNTEKIILLVGHANSRKEAFAQYWFGIDILNNNSTDAYNQEYTITDNNTILLFLNLSDSLATNNFNKLFVEEWVKKTNKVKIIVCVSTDDFFDKDIYFEILQNELDAKLPDLIRYNKKNIGLIVTSEKKFPSEFERTERFGSRKVTG